ncbi:hypothetical protein CRUP_011409 [Coryphaenoides rupestris]|nr:hypothetical protein CRUP_011409 [Coryphaenoides rupestris]
MMMMTMMMMTMMMMTMMMKMMMMMMEARGLSVRSGHNAVRFANGVSLPLFLGGGGGEWGNKLQKYMSLNSFWPISMYASFSCALICSTSWGRWLTSRYEYDFPPTSTVGSSPASSNSSSSSSSSSRCCRLTAPPPRALAAAAAATKAGTAGTSSSDSLVSLSESLPLAVARVRAAAVAPPPPLAPPPLPAPPPPPPPPPSSSSSSSSCCSSAGPASLLVDEEGAHHFLVLVRLVHVLTRAAVLAGSGHAPCTVLWVSHTGRSLVALPSPASLRWSSCSSILMTTFWCGSTVTARVEEEEEEEEERRRRRRRGGGGGGEEGDHQRRVRAA